MQSLDRVQAEQERLKKMLQGVPKAYVDKVMVPGDLPSLAGEELEGSGSASGYRAYMTETRLNAAQTDDGLQLRSSRELGQRLAYRHQTLNYGIFDAQVDLRATSGDPQLGFGLGAAGRERSARFTLRNLGLPLTPRAFADTAAGDIYSEVTDGLARTYRMSLGHRPVRGLATRLFGDGFDVRAGTGERGAFAGGPFPGFEPLPGRVSWLGGSTRLPNGLLLGLQANQASGVLEADGTGTTQDIASVAASAGFGGAVYADGSSRGRLTLIRSRTTGLGQPREAQGWFVEGGVAGFGLRHEFGVYAADDNLYFGDTQLPADNRGAYWRVDGGGMRHSWGLGLQVEDTNPDRSSETQANRLFGFQANGEYRFNRNQAVGGSLHLERRRNLSVGGPGQADRGARSLYASGYFQTQSWGGGRTRVRATVRRNEILVTDALPASGEEVEIEHDWIRGRYETMRPELVTTLGLARERSNGVSVVTPTAGLSFRFWPDADWSVSGHLRYTSSDSNLTTSRGLSGVVDTEKQLADGWRVGASLSLNQAVVDLNRLVDGEPRVTRSNDKIASVYVRWEGASGTTARGLGTRTGQPGGGGLGGIVFFDADRDGEQQAAEKGVPGVEVLLDGSFRATTDANGRFDFPLVTTGRHQLSLRLESVPLPWGAAAGQTWNAEVPLRGLATIRIPVVRVGE
ncbi:hypothetical protein FN976_26725 [Caenimonas sedimenti]|uniref:SD-repeat containing protein B domain-containing protein n=1 Tax=Caenimonas sedimenti TaxID=2596921 RepID=A0A562ZF14_9BURK|nr:SdrD B-like domain-containing protein [Caenimonas sedimenti]TWO66141.1 hypothetical protein FN976_26725 [Caenimonas sedimenti]